MSKLAHSHQPAMDKIEAEAICEDGFQADEEANAFAMELLMPVDWLRADIAKLGGIDIEDENKVRKLAKKYAVSIAVMTLRLGQLSQIPTPHKRRPTHD